MLTKEVSVLLNEQINHEFYSAYLYLNFANYYIEEGLEGFANWFNVQAQEEQDHAMLFRQYLQNNGEKVTFSAIKAPDVTLQSFRDPLAESLKHERYVTNLIHKIYGAAHTVKDFRTLQFLDWFVKEQGEEEKNAEDLIKRFDLFGSEPKSLYMLDSEMAARAYVAPTLTL